jgi:hypothetical protein
MQSTASFNISRITGTCPLTYLSTGYVRPGYTSKGSCGTGEKVQRWMRHQAELG